MATIVPESLLAPGGVTFTCTDGRTGTIPADARRAYDHIILTIIGMFPSAGLTDTQAKLILSASNLAHDKIEDIWQLTETIEAQGLPDGHWTLLEIYVALHFVQDAEGLSPTQIAVQFAGSAPSEVSQGIRRKSSYAEAGIVRRRTADHDPTSPCASPAPTAFLRHSVSNATTAAGLMGQRFNPTLPDQDEGSAASVSQAGLETLEPVHVHANALRHLGGNQMFERVNSARTDGTIGGQRLAALIQSRCPDIQIEPDIERGQPRPVESSIVEKTIAHDALVHIRRRDPKFTGQPKGLSKMFKSKKSKERAADSRNWTFTGPELSLALHEAVGETGRTGVAKELIAMGADVSHYKSKLKGSRIGSTPINYAKIAASRNDTDMLSLLLTSGIPPDKAAEALEQSVEQNSPSVVTTLLQHGVDPNVRNGSIFASAIASQNPVIIKLLLRSRSKVLQDCLTRNLPTTIEQGRIEIVTMLVTYGADPCFEDGLALRKAVQAQRIDLLLTLMKGVKGSARSKISSSVISEAFSATSLITIAEQRLLVDILLCAGASGDPVARLLVNVVRAGQQSIARLLVKHRASLKFNKAEALRIAVSTNNTDILSILLLGTISQDVASSVVDDVPHTCNDDQCHFLLSLLIEKGANGMPISRALVRATQRKSMKTIGLLLDHGAIVEIDDSQPLRMATTGMDVQMLALLLSKGKPSSRSLQAILPLVPHSPIGLRYEMTRHIIHAAGPNCFEGSVLDDALVAALRRPPHEFNQPLPQLVDMLIAAGANVDCRGGVCFQLAAESESMGVLDLLVRNMIQPASLSPAVPVCIRMRDLKRRRPFVELLLRHGAKGPEVNQALIDAVAESPTDKVLIKSLSEIADLDYLGGRAILIAMRRTSVEVLGFLIDTGRSSQKARLDAVQVLFEPDVKQRPAKLKLLLHADIGQQGLNDTLIQEMRGSGEGAVIELLLEHNASCEHQQGKSLELAIRNQDSQALGQLTARKPDRRLLGAMVPKTMALTGVLHRRACLSLLLGGGATGRCVDRALVTEVETPGFRDRQLIRLMVEHGARVDYSDARAITFAVSTPLDVGILMDMMTGTAASAVVAALIPLSMNHQQKERLPLLRILLENGACGAHVDAALVAAVSGGVKEQATVDLLLEYGASVDYNEAEAVKVAALAGSCSMLECLLSKNPDPEHFDEAIKLAMQSLSSHSRVKPPDRLQSVRLLTKDKTISPRAVSPALAQAVREEDYQLTEHLIESGADPNFGNGESVVLATQQLNKRSLRLLLQSNIKLTPRTSSRAFSNLPQDTDRWQNQAEVIEYFDSIFISLGATGPSVDQTFLSAVRSSHAHAASFVTMIINCKTALDVNFERGRSLCIAVRRARFEWVDYLLSQQPNELTLRSGFMAIFESGCEERILIKLAQIFFSHSNGANDLYLQHNESADSALYQTLHRHGDKPNLLQNLLDNGCGSDERFSWQFDDTIGAEDTSALLWLLCQGHQSIDELTVDILLRHGADPNFRTYRSGISPLMMAASIPDTDLTLKLLEASAYPDVQDNAEQTPLQYATIAKNIKGMEHLLRYNAIANDESLHIAARQLDIPAVQLLLTHHADTELPGTLHCGGRVPLGELCRMTDLTHNPSHLKEMLTLLCKATKDLGTRTDGRSFLLLSLDNQTPLKIATALLTSCQALKEGLNDEHNTFARGSLRYSPTAYLRHFKCAESSGFHSMDLERRCCTVDNCPAPKLESLLRAHGCEDHFWDAAAGANQPRGFCNPPVHIITSIEEAKAARKEQARIERAEAEERARRERLQRDLDTAAAADRRRERERLRVLEGRKAADIRATKKKAAADAHAIQQRAREERRAAEQIAAVEADQDEMRRQRKRREDHEEAERERVRAQAQEDRETKGDRRRERALRERSNIQIDQKKREANIKKQVLSEERILMGERRRLVESTTGMFREAQLSGVERGGMGKILGEIE